jgi:hypothetical protein
MDMVAIDLCPSSSESRNDCAALEIVPAGDAAKLKPAAIDSTAPRASLATVLIVIYKNSENA